MTSTPCAVTLIVATYRPGTLVQRVLDSLDALTMPADQVEVIFADDGSGDGTVDVLRAYAAGRPNTRVLEMPHSGWPSRPRNAALDQARGQYVLFLDHDDALFPDGLRRVHAFAVTHDADVVSAKESRVRAPWFAMRHASAGTTVDVRPAGGIARLQPLVPHKLYRRALLQEHGIRFPEGARVLWEDWYVNVPAYRHGRVVSVVADVPLYLWHSGAGQATHTFDPARADFWDRLAELLSFVDRELHAPGLLDDRRYLLRYTLHTWVLDRVARALTRSDPMTPAEIELAVGRARGLLARHGTPDVLAGAGRRHRALAHLLRSHRVEELRGFADACVRLTATAHITAARWTGGQLRLEVEVLWRGSAEAPDGRSGAVRLDAGSAVAEVVPADLLDLGAELAGLQTRIAVHDRFGQVTWLLPAQTATPYVRHDEDGTPTVVHTMTVALDPATAMFGGPLADAVWDLRVHTEWYAVERTPTVSYRGRRLVAALGSRAAVAYSNKWDGMTLDLGQNLRSLVLDAAPPGGRLGPLAGFAAPLTAVAAHGHGRIPTGLLAVPADLDVEYGDHEHDAERLAELDGLVSVLPFTADVVVDDAGARLAGTGSLPPGAYRLWIRRPERLRRTRYALTVDSAGDAVLERT